LSSSSHPKALVIGFDGGTFDLIEPMMSAGKLPNLAKMAAEGLKSNLRSTVLPLSPPAWTTFLSGRNPGAHGIYDFAKRVEGTYKFRPTSSADRRSRPIWDIIGHGGGNSVIVNVPLTYPPTRLKGVMISGFPTPTAGQDYTYPQETLARLRSEFGDFSIHKPKVLYRKGREKEIAEETNAITRTQTKITKFLMGQMDWSLVVSVFDATDVIGHYFWAYLDPKHPKYDPRLAPKVVKMVEDVHVELDRAVGVLFDAAGEESLRMVVSDHGFGPVYYGVYVNNWLLEKKYMRFKGNISARAKYFAFRHGFNVYNFLRLGKKLGLVKSIESAYSTRSLSLRMLNFLSLDFDDIDWAKTRVYSFGNMGQLYLNLKGREPEGVVERSEAPALIDELVEGLRSLKDPYRGELMFDSVHPKDELYSGEETFNAPDVVFLDQKMVYAAHRMFELGSSRLVTPHPIYSGNHKMEGILLASGPTVRGSRPVPEPNIIDLAPSILAYLGLGVPAELEGRVIPELVGDRPAAHNPPGAAVVSELVKVTESVREIVSNREGRPRV
jgi:predicted AlkP superfamily phosphohydrolase/phosphomutase